MPDMPAKGSIGPFRQVRARFISGLLVLVPLAVTVVVLKFILGTLTAFVVPLLEPWLGDVPQVALVPAALAVAFALIYLAGLVATHIVGRRLIQFGETVLLKLPIVRSVYGASKQVVDTLSQGTQAAFQAVVLVAFPHPASQAVGFVTGHLLDPSGRRRYRVFVPTTPNPTSGFLLILPAEAVEFTDISVEEGLKMIVSGGVLAPRDYRHLPTPGHEHCPPGPAASPPEG